MTSTVEPQPAHRVSERQGSAGPSAGTGEHLVHGRLGRLGNQLGTQVLPQRLACRARPLPQDRMSVLGYVHEVASITADPGRTPPLVGNSNGGWFACSFS